MKAIYDPPHFRPATVGVVTHKRDEDGNVTHMAGIVLADDDRAEFVIQKKQPFDVDEDDFNHLVARYHGQFHRVSDE